MLIPAAGRDEIPRFWPHDFWKTHFAAISAQIGVAKLCTALAVTRQSFDGYF